MKRSLIGLFLATLATLASAQARAADFLVHVGGICSQWFGDENMRGIPGFINVDARVNQTRETDQAVDDLRRFLDGTCPAGGAHWCRLYAFSNGATAISKLMSITPAGRWQILGVMFSGSAEGGSELSDNGMLAEWFLGCDAADEIGPSANRAWNHHDTNGLLFELLAGNDGYNDFRLPGSWYLDGEDDGAVGMDSSGGYVNTGAYDNICESRARWEFHTPFSSVATSGKHKGQWVNLCAREWNHDEMKYKGADCLNQHFTHGTACRS